MRIPPSYELTPAILELVEKIERNRSLINSKSIIPLQKQRIERVSLLKSALYSAKIEGNELEEHNFARSPRNQARKEITNLVLAITYLDKEILLGVPVSLEQIKSLQERVMEDLAPAAGKLRREPWAVYNSVGNVVYLAPPARKVAELMTRLVEYINTVSDEPALVTALMAHFILEKVHPFEDGNGRVGRLLIPLVLRSKKGDFKIPLVLEEEINKRRGEYYFHLDQEGSSLEEYLLFMLGVVYHQTEELIKQLAFVPDQNEGQLTLSPRQEEIYRIVGDHQYVSLDFIQRRFIAVPGRTLRYDLKKLQDKGLIVKTASTRGALYKAAG